MTIGSLGFALPLMLLLLVSLVGAAQTVPVVWYACNVQKFDPTASFNATLNNLLSNMEQHTPSSGVGYKKSVAGSEGSPTAYGESVCDAPLCATECTNCLTSIFNQLLAICGFAIGARGNSTQCSLRYEQYQF